MLQTVRAKKVDKNLGSFFYNLDHNILELYNALVQIRLTTSKAKRDIYYSKLSRTVASRVAERLKKLGNNEMLGKSKIWLET